MPRGVRRQRPVRYDAAVSEPTLPRIVEALLFAAPDPLTVEKIREASGAENAAAVKEAIEAIRADCDAAGRPYLLQEVAGGWRLATRPEYAPWVGRLARERQGKLSAAALETLAVIAYRQPISRAEIEAIRGVQAGPILQTLTERDLIRVSGKSEALGHPLLYSTTKQFLEAFGLNTVEDLPSVREFGSFAAQGEKPRTVPEESPSVPS